MANKHAVDLVYRLAGSALLNEWNKIAAYRPTGEGLLNVEGNRTCFVEPSGRDSQLIVIDDDALLESEADALERYVCLFMGFDHP